MRFGISSAPAAFVAFRFRELFAAVALMDASTAIARTKPPRIERGAIVGRASPFRVAPLVQLAQESLRWGILHEIAFHGNAGRSAQPRSADVTCRSHNANARPGLSFCFPATTSGDHG